MSYTYKRAGQPSPESIRKAIEVLEAYAREPKVGPSAQTMVDFLHSVLNPMTDMTALMESLMDKLHRAFPDLGRWNLTMDRTASIYFYSHDLDRLAKEEGEEAENEYSESLDRLTLAVEREAQKFVGSDYGVALSPGSPGHFRLHVSKR